ncbi:MAG: type II toxin-antitoxin system RelE/ParE family toxin [Tissierellia bacterium]|nr:type II toxin-antitoxin system RelE/ParE family toxin [Tissierellia bacterium]
MNGYTVVISEIAVKQLKKLDKSIAKIIVHWIEKNLEDCEDPRLKGKPLKGDRGSQWRYRVGNYRLIAEIKDKKLIILIISIGHRKEIYDD